MEPVPPLQRRHALAFAVVALLLGLAYGAILPPFEAPDEPPQFYRAAMVAEGSFLARRDYRQERYVGEEIPARLIQIEHTWPAAQRGHPEKKVTVADWQKLWEVQPLDRHLRHFAVVVNTATYSPLSYVGAALAMRVAFALQLRPLAVFYAARLGGLLAWICLVTLALAILPLGRWLVALLALTPMSLHQAAAVSADSWNHGWLLLTFAVLLRVALSPDGPVRRAEVWTVLALLFGTGLLRQTFVPLALVAFLMPRHRFENRGHQWAFYLGAGLAAALPALAWTLANRENVVWQNPELLPEAQMKFLAEHPLHLLRTLPATLAEHGMRWAREFVGCLGWLDTALPAWFVGGFWVLILAAALLRTPGEPRLPFSGRVPLLLAFGAMVLLTLTALFVLVTPPTSPTIEGIQGRYFTPLAPLALISLTWRGIPASERAQAALVLGAACVANICALTILCARFWGA